MQESRDGNIVLAWQPIDISGNKTADKAANHSKKKANANTIIDQISAIDWGGWCK